MYDLHASASGWMKFFNDTYGNKGLKLSRCHIWAAFIQESIWQVSVTSKMDFSLWDIALIDEVTQSAFMILGQSGVIQSAENHLCAECSQPYQAQSDLISNSNDHSAVLGVDDVGGEVIQASSNNELEMDVDMPNVTMKVLDGIVVGTKVYLICNVLQIIFLC